MLLKAIGFFLLSSVKFAVATLPISAIFSFGEAWLISVSGGIAGAFFFLYIWDYILRVWSVYIIRHEKKAKEFKINKRKRKIITIKNSYGYWGIVILTPVILSIPIGAFLLDQYFKNQRYKFLHLSLSITFWGTIFIGFFELFW